MSSPETATAGAGRGGAGPVLELRGAGKQFGERVALYPLDLEVPAARTLALIGPSGCGKTTVLRLMLGLLFPDQGEVRFQGTPIRRDNLLALRRQLGYVVQEGGLFPHLDAAGNVTLMARHLGWDPPRVRQRLGQLTDLVRLPRDTLSRFPGQLSGGQRQRVSLMRALMLDPQVLLLDEPLGAIDPLMRAELQADLAAIFKQLGKSVVLVTHDLSEAAFFADQLVLMREGVIVQRGSLRDMMSAPADPFVVQFIEAQPRFDPMARNERRP
jgi:osmoprotectant transport system ATP-binding protein